MKDLLNQRCRALEGGAPMSDQDIHSHLAAVSGWQASDGAIEKTFSFKNFHETMAFVNALAWICHVEDHHPALAITYAGCVVRFSTHSVGGISANDFICAAKVNALVAFVG